MPINLQTPINHLSYGVCGLNLSLELSKLTEVSLFPIGQSSVNTSQNDASLISKLIENQGVYDVNAPSVRLFHQFSLAERVGRARHFGFPIFELNQFNDRELNHLNSCDALLTPTEWSAAILKDNLRKDIEIHKVPLGVNREIFKPIEVPKWESTRILAVGKTEVRKGHDILHEVFSKAFEHNDLVELYISWDNPFISDTEKKEWTDLYKNSKLGSKIKFVPYQQSPHQLNTLYNSVDCLISLSRAEGWNLPLLEGLSCGRRVIATEYSGHTEFLDGRNSYPIEITEFESAYDGKWFHGAGEWTVLADTQKEQAIEYMRTIHKKKQNGDSLFNEEGVKTANLFTWENSAKMLLKAVAD